MPPIKPMPSAAAPRQTDPDYHKDCAAQFAQGVAPWPRPATGSRTSGRWRA